MKFISWLLGQSKFERMLGVLQTQMALQAQAQDAMLRSLEKLSEANTANSKIFTDWMAMAQQASQPQVRVMNDLDEAVNEQLRELKNKYERDQKISQTVQKWQDPLPNPQVLSDIFADMRNDLS